MLHHCALGNCRATHYNYIMIRSFKSKPLQELFEKGDTAGLNPQWKKKLNLHLSLLNATDAIEDLLLPGLHPLTGNRQGDWATKITGNYRLTWRWDEEGDAWDVDIEDYH